MKTCSSDVTTVIVTIYSITNSTSMYNAYIEVSKIALHALVVVTAWTLSQSVPYNNYLKLTIQSDGI